MIVPTMCGREHNMLTCTSGTIEKKKNGSSVYYWLRLNLVDDSATERKKRYQTKRIPTGLKVGEKTGRISNIHLANEQLTQAIREFAPIGQDTQFNDYVKYWLAEIGKSHDLETSTKEAYKYKANYIIQYFSNIDMTLAEVDTSAVRSFIDSLHSVTTAKGKQLSDVSIRDIYKTCSQVFTFAQLNGHLFKANPCASVKLPKIKSRQDDEPYISESQIEDYRALLAEHCQSNIILQYAYLIGLFYGLRRSEICGLKWSAIRNGNIYIEHTVTRVNTMVAKDYAKTDASKRHCALLPEIKEMFDQIRQEQERNRFLFGNRYKESDYIFTWQDGRSFSPDYLSKHFKKMIAKSTTLDKRLHLHNLRASCVSILAHKGVSLSDIALWIGDSVETTTKYYLRTCSENQLQTGLAMANVLF